MLHPYTEDQLVEQPATRGKVEGSMLKAKILPKAIIAGRLNEWLTAKCCKSHIYNMFLFE
jgi:hypothetical protein